MHVEKKIRLTKLHNIVNAVGNSIEEENLLTKKHWFLKHNTDYEPYKRIMDHNTEISSKTKDIKWKLGKRYAPKAIPVVTIQIIT